MKKSEVIEFIKAAKGEIMPDICVTNARIVDVINGETVEKDLLIHKDRFVGFAPSGEGKAHKTIDADGLFLAPGFVDAHVHIESSHLEPAEFSNLIVPCGTTTIIADPHEICNVCGIDGFDYIEKESEGLPLDVKIMFPSCVPATDIEHSGADLTAAEIARRIDRERCFGLGEMMNFPGVLAADEKVIDKLALAYENGKVIDGHAPGVAGHDLDAYALAGIKTDHECSTPEELRDRTARGMYVLLRRGSACHNVKDLAAGVNDYNYRRCLFCTDDKQPVSILEEGHINCNIRIAMENGIDFYKAIAMATVNSAECYGLKDTGLIAPGYYATFNLFDKDINVRKVFVKGRLVAQNGCMMENSRTKGGNDKVLNRMNIRNLSPDMFDVRCSSGRANVIGIIPGGVVSAKLVEDIDTENGLFRYNPDRDIVKVCVIERHKGLGTSFCGLLKGYGLKRGAVATTIAHDSHNLIVAGIDNADMMKAVEELKRIGGGMVAVLDGKVLASLSHPIAGLLSDMPAKEVADALRVLHDVAQKELEVNTDIDPYMTLCFMSLPVIPELKITDIGLFDVSVFSYIPIEA